MMRSAVFLALALSIVPAASHAKSMCCALKQVFEVSVDGTLVPNRLSEAYLKNDLVVDMHSGVIYHTGFGNERFPIKNVLDSGSRSSSFKLISSSIPARASNYDHAMFVNTVVMQIDTWVEGTSKPFVVFEDSNLGVGVCQ